ncbi:MAG: YibE/F family protein [Candidatus Blackburnbacteria bacterium]|nr:YibE/F family protein [Candidatus Blackburnbacteria bacterium]
MKTKFFLNIFTLTFLLVAAFFLPITTFAQESSTASEQTMEAKIIKVLEEKSINTENGSEQLYQKLEMEITSGPRKGNVVKIENGNVPVANPQRYKVNDKLIVNYSKNYQGADSYYIADYVRRDGLLLLFVIFVIIAILVGRWHGLSSLVGMALSFVVIFKFILPQIMQGQDPIMIATIAALAIVPTTFYLSHGLNKKTTIAIGGTIAALIITGLLAEIFVEVTNLTGFASEEASYLQTINSTSINIKGLLLAGIIIGGLGILDDVTISQAAIVAQLKEAAPKSKFIDLYNRAMKIGRDHIASVVNTLVLVYASAALPLLLLFIDSPKPFSEVINYELIATEIVRTLVASIGLVMAVPITTLLSALVFAKNKN